MGEFIVGVRRRITFYISVRVGFEALFVNSLHGQVEERMGWFGKISFIDAVSTHTKLIMVLRIIIALNIVTLLLRSEERIDMMLKFLGIDGSIVIF